MLQKLFFLTLLLLCFTFTALAQTADEVIAKHVQARGGAEKLKAVKSIKQSGSFIQQGQELPLTIQVKRPNNLRFEISVQSQSVILGFDGTTGWGINPFLGSKEPQKLPDEQLKDVIDQADIDGVLVDYKEKGHKVELVGKEDLDGSPAYKLKVSKKNGDTQYIFIDAGNYLEVKAIDKQKTPGGEVEVETYQSDFKAVEGVLFPYAIESKAQGQTVLQIKLNKIEVNSAIEDTIFKMPAKSAEK